jgi:hypothetical protein
LKEIIDVVISGVSFLKSRALQLKEKCCIFLEIEFLVAIITSGLNGFVDFTLKHILLNELLISILSVREEKYLLPVLRCSSSELRELWRPEFSST